MTVIEWVSVGFGMLVTIIGASIYIGGYRQMVDNQRLATRRAFQKLKRMSARLRSVEAALYSHKMLKQPTSVGDEDDDEDEA